MTYEHRVRDQIARFEALAGRTLERVVGLEWALVEAASDGMPVFADRRVPCLNVDPLYLGLDSGEWVIVGPLGFDGDDVLEIATSTGPGSGGQGGGTTRLRSLDEVGAGRIESVQTHSTATGITEVRMTVASSDLVLIPGDIVGLDDDGFMIQRNFDSILLFTTDPDNLGAWDHRDRFVLR